MRTDKYRSKIFGSVIVAVLLTGFLAGCTNNVTPSTQDSFVRAMGGGSFGLDRGSLYAVWKIFGFGAGKVSLKFSGTVKLTPVYQNPQGGYTEYGVPTYLNVEGMQKVKSDDGPSKSEKDDDESSQNGKGSGSTLIWGARDLPPVQPLEISAANSNLRMGWKVQNTGCFSGTVVQGTGEVQQETSIGAKLITQDDGEVYLYNPEAKRFKKVAILSKLMYVDFCGE